MVMGKDQCGHRGESNNVFSLRSSGSWPILRRNVSILCCFTYSIYLYYYTQPLHDRVLAEFFPMYEGEFTVFRAGFLAIQFKTKMHKIGTRIAFLLEKKILPSSCLYGLWKLLQSSILLRGSGGGVVGKCYWINMNTIVLCYWALFPIFLTRIKGKRTMPLGLISGF